MNTNTTLTADEVVARVQGSHLADFGSYIAEVEGTEVVVTYLYDRSIEDALRELHTNLSEEEEAESLLAFSASDFDELRFEEPEIAVETGDVAVRFDAPRFEDVQRLAVSLGEELAR